MTPFDRARIQAAIDRMLDPGLSVIDRIQEYQRMDAQFTKHPARMLDGVAGKEYGKKR